MSSILKALRKLEEEKSAMGDEKVDIARDILKRSGRKKESQLFWPLTSAFLLIVIVGSGLYLWLQEESATPRQGQVIVEKFPASPTPRDRTESLPADRPDSLQISSSTKIETTVDKKIIPAPVTPAEKTAETAAPGDEKSALKAAPAPAALRPNGAPFLKLSGIAFRKNPLERIAIINDLPVMQGTKIEGAEVIEIQPDRIILRWKNKNFEQVVEKPAN